MCGIYARIYNTKVTKNSLQKYAKILAHRGPDSVGYKSIQTNDTTIDLLHTRLHINGDSTPQPIVDSDNKLFLIINGEIFNWRQLSDELDYTCTKSDCEIILPLYKKYISEVKDNTVSDVLFKKFFEKLEGQYSFFLYDSANDSVFIGRDPIGVTPLYIGFGKDNSISVCSELKCLDTESSVSIFPPRSYMYTSIDDLVNETFVIKNYLDLYKFSGKFNFGSTLQDYTKIVNDKLTASVQKQLSDLIKNENELIKNQINNQNKNDNENSFGVLLSGGLDSSLIASLVSRLSRDMGYSKKIKTFSIGVHKDVPDLVSARRVAEWIGSEHHEFYFTVQDGISALRDVIWYIESYDCTSVRASTAMYLLTRQIHQKFPNLRVLFSGELADELFCYLYGANAPDDDAFQNETINLVENVHKFDCLRANKTCMANSVEVRVPFTDLDFVKTILGIPAKFKRFGEVNGQMEKQLLRESFSRSGYLPNEILWRKKEQFSDGVSGFRGKEDNWIDAVKDYADNLFSDLEFAYLKDDFVYNQPGTKEKLLYRLIFRKLFHEKCDKTISQWVPKWSSTSDPSGRVQSFWTQN